MDKTIDRTGQNIQDVCVFLADLRSPDVFSRKLTAARESEAGHALVGIALGTYLGHPPSPYDLAGESRAPGKKPFFPAFPGFHYNVSHSGGIAVCALSESPVGVDIQEIPADAGRALSISGHFFSAEEIRALDSASADHTAMLRLFCRFWTARESYIKLTGRGLKESFAGYRPDLDAGRIVTNLPGREIFLAECPAPDGFCLTVCSYEPVRARLIPTGIST